MLASYVLSRTLVPTLAMYLLRVKEHGAAVRGIFARFQQRFEQVFERVRERYHGLLQGFVFRRKIFIPSFLGICLILFALLPFLGEDFFPDTDSGQFILHVRGPTGMRIEETARLFDLVEDQIRKEIPAAEIDNILDNIGLPYSAMNTQHLTNGTLGVSDGDILVSLKEHHGPTARYVSALRGSLPRTFPAATFYMLPADITWQRVRCRRTRYWVNCAEFRV
jgi:multidrug efflux pump subunit AcrB